MPELFRKSTTSAVQIPEANLTRSEIVRVTGISNREFLETYARPGRVGLVGGVSPIEKVIRRAERHVDADKRWSLWSHSFLLGERRSDEHHWIIESDLHIARKHIRLGVQENRLTKYFDESVYRSLAILDFGLSDEHVLMLLREGLELVASRARYSLRELLGTLIALHRPELRGRDNLLAREKAFYCSAFVQHLFRKAGIELAPGVHGKNTTPEDISRTPVPHITYLLERPAPFGKFSRLAVRLRRLKKRPRK